MVVGVSAFGLARVLLQFADWHTDIAILAVCVAAGLVYGLVGLRLLDSGLREKISQTLRSVRLAVS
jgi:hypothetical protein